MSPLGIFGDQKPKQHTQKLPQKPKKVIVSIGKQVGKGSYPPDAKVTAREIIQDARDEAFRIKKAAEEEASKIRQESLELEKRLAQKEDLLDERTVQVEKQEKQLTTLREALLIQEEELAKLKSELAKRIKEAEEEVKAQAEFRAREILANAMIAGATDWVAEYTVSSVKLESSEIKGRIIGKEGRNIRAFELATGVDVELDSEDTHEVRLSSFDPIRREIARVALEWLVKDTRIQPARIEQLVEK